MVLGFRGETKSVMDKSTLCQQHCHSCSGLHHAPANAPKTERLHIQTKHAVAYSHFMWLSGKPLGLSCSPFCPVCALTSQIHSESWSNCPKGINGKTSTAADCVTELTMSPSSQLLNSSPCLSQGDFLFWGKDNVPVSPLIEIILRRGKSGLESETPTELCPDNSSCMLTSWERQNKIIFLHIHVQH